MCEYSSEGLIWMYRVLPNFLQLLHKQFQLQNPIDMFTYAFDLALKMGCQTRALANG